MENLENNNVLEEVVEVIEPVEVFETAEEVITTESDNTKNIAIGAAIVGGLVAGGFALKKMWDKRKAAKKATTSTVTVQFEDIEEVQNNEEE